MDTIVHNFARLNLIVSVPFDFATFDVDDDDGGGSDDVGLMGDVTNHCRRRQMSSLRQQFDGTN